MAAPGMAAPIMAAPGMAAPIMAAPGMAAPIMAAPGMAAPEVLNFPPCDASITCQRGFYLHPQLCQCLLICDTIQECKSGFKWDFIECACVRESTTGKSTKGPKCAPVGQIGVAQSEAGKPKQRRG
jgi:hypothetical protein